MSKSSDNFSFSSSSQQTTLIKYITLDNLWKLGIDAKDHCYGRMVYDENKRPESNEPAEPGYIQVMEAALMYMFQTLDKPLSELLIRQLHYIALDHIGLDDEPSVYSSSSYLLFNENSEKVSEFNFKPCRCPMIFLTREGLEEMASYDFYKGGTYQYDETLKKPKRIILTPDSIDYFLEISKTEFKVGEGGIKDNLDKSSILNGFIRDYETSIRSSQSDDDRILAIATLAKKIECAHFFWDGNLRTVRLIILKLLAQNNLPLTCMLNPNIIDGHSSKEIAAEIKEGMKIYQKIRMEETGKEISNNDVSITQTEHIVKGPARNSG